MDKEYGLWVWRQAPVDMLFLFFSIHSPSGKRPDSSPRDRQLSSPSPPYPPPALALKLMFFRQGCISTSEESHRAWIWTNQNLESMIGSQINSSSQANPRQSDWIRGLSLSSQRRFPLFSPLWLWIRKHVTQELLAPIACWQGRLKAEGSQHRGNGAKKWTKWPWFKHLGS